MYSSKRSVSNSVCGNLVSMLRRSAVMLAMLVMTAATAWAAQPVSYLDACTGEKGYIHLQGWAYDPDASAQSIEVFMYIYTDADCTNQYGYMTEFTAGVPRADVNKAKGITGDHGFNIDIDVYPPGVYWVKLFAVDANGDGDSQIGSTTAVTVTGYGPPIGSLEACTGGEELIHVEGWAYDPDASAQSIGVHVYVYTDEGCTSQYGDVRMPTANVPRSDVNSSKGITGDHGFNADITIADAGEYWVKVFAIDTNGDGDSQIGSTTAVAVTAVVHSDDAKTLPYSYGFETGIMLYDMIVEGWIPIDCAENSKIVDCDPKPYSGSYCFQFLYPLSEQYQYLISPEINNGGRNFSVSFYFYNYDTNYFQVGYSTTTGFISAFTWEDVTDRGSWRRYEKEFPANVKYVAIRANITSKYKYLCLDDFTFAVSGCLPPENLTVSDFNDQSATLTWTAPSTTRTVTGYAYQIVQHGSSWGADTEVMEPLLTSVTFDNLLPNTSYDFRVNTLYAEGKSLDYATTTILTDCSGSVSPPITQDFENGMGCWRVVNGNSMTGITSPYNQSTAFRFCGNAPQYLFSPQLDCPEEITVSFYHHINAEPMSFQVGYSTTTHAPSAFTWDTEITSTEWGYLKYEHNFPAGTKYIAVKYTSNSRGSLNIDNINIFVVGVLPPAQVSASAIASQSATLTWDAVNGATGYAYQYKKAGESTWSDEVTTTETSATISDLTADTDYDAHVKAIYGNNASIYTTIQFTTATAPPYEQEFEAGMGRWTMVDCYPYWTEIDDIWGTGRRTHAAHDSNVGFQFGDYPDNPIPQYLISPRFGGDKAITLSFYYRSAIGYPETIYVGYSTTNNDKDAFTFGDAITVSSTDWTKYENTFPPEARYFAVKYTSNENRMFIDDFSFEEYSAYAKPTTIGTNELTETKAKVAWNVPDEPVTSFVYQYKKSDETIWSAEATIYANNVTLENLTPNTYYKFRVKALYGSDASNYATYTFQTDANMVDLPYTDGFENGMGGWRMIYCDGVTEIIKADTPNSGNYCFLFADTRQHQYLLSPHFAGGTPMKVSFYYQNYANYPAYFMVGYTSSKEGQITWGNLVTASNGEWTLYETFCPAETQYVFILCAKQGSLLFLDDFSFTEMPDIVFADNADNTTTISDYSGKEVVATLQGRTLYRDGDWNTLCLPFDINNFARTPLEGATVKTLSSSAFSNGTLTLNFEDATSIEAGKPYIVKWNDGLNLTINSTDDWNAFAEKVNGGKSYAGKTVLLGADIDVSTMVGTADSPFSGTFEGAGHTLNVSISDGGEGAAPFRYVSGATIRNVKTAGTVSGNHCAGLVGIALGGTNSIRDCYVTASVSGGSYAGGILGNGTISTTTISNCMFSGSLTATNMGILYGWGEEGGTHTVENCVANGTYADLSVIIDEEEGHRIINLLLGNGTKTVTNCWKNTEAGSQGDNGLIIYMGGEHPLISYYLGSQWTYENNDFVLNPTVNILDTNIENPVFLGVTVDANVETAVDFTGGQFVGTFSPLVSTAGLLFDAHNPNNGACRAALSIDEPEHGGLTFCGWYTDPEYNNPATTIPFADDGTVTLYAKFTGETTDVLFIPYPAEVEHPDVWYDMLGRQLDNAPTTQGLYIHDGKIISIKKAD